MKLKMICLLLVAGLILTLSGTTQAVTLQPDGVKFKSFDWSASTVYDYSDDLLGKTLFRNNTVPGYNPANPNHVLFQDAIDAGDLTIYKPATVIGDEDSWGIFHVTTIWGGDMNPGGTDIIQEEPPYWVIGDGYLQGIFWGIRDQRVEIFTEDLIRIYSTGLEFELWDTTDGGTGDDYLPSERTALNLMPGWVDGTGELDAKGVGAWYRYVGDADPTGIDGQTLVYLDVESGKWLDPLYPGDPYGLQEVWTITQGSIGGLFDTSKDYEIYQTWSVVGDLSEPWIRSEDAGRGFVVPVPEPMTMLGMFLGIGGLTGYVRKRRMA